MSREAARWRARERAHELDELLGPGAVVELLGIRLVVLYAESRRTQRDPPDRPAGAPRPVAPRSRGV